MSQIAERDATGDTILTMTIFATMYREPQKKFLLWKWGMTNITADNEKSTIIFLTNAGDSFCNSYIYHLVGLHIRQWQSDSNTTSSLKNNKTIWDKFITCTHTFTWRQRTAWNFTCVCKSSIWISHCQQ